MFKQLFQKFILDQGQDLHVQIFRYIITGGLAFAIDFALLAILVEFFGVHYLLAVAVAYCAGLFTTYFLNRTWVFSFRRYGAGKEFTIFTMIAAAALGLNELIIWFFTDQIHVHYLISKIIAVVVVFALSFYFRKKFLFSEKQTKLE